MLCRCQHRLNFVIAQTEALSSLQGCPICPPLSSVITSALLSVPESDCSRLLMWVDSSRIRAFAAGFHPVSYALGSSVPRVPGILSLLWLKSVPLVQLDRMGVTRQFVSGNLSCFRTSAFAENICVQTSLQVPAFSSFVCKPWNWTCWVAWWFCGDVAPLPQQPHGLHSIHTQGFQLTRTPADNSAVFRSFYCNPSSEREGVSCVLICISND